MIPEAASAAEEIYKENILDHYRHPRNRGAFSPCAFKHREINASCGDDLELFVDLADGKMRKVAFEGRGCAVSIAAVSMLTEHVAGMTLAEIEKLGKDAMLGLLGIPVGPSRLKCALLGLKTLQNGIAAHRTAL
ncbi:iron-sulfur cluster assembly scaffold protein [Candidatus Uhrbacteria bacterium]|nr:iron-sulfur cluster assembly scaffold protein [Candidatus Uhrbacteria bacterium]